MEAVLMAARPGDIVQLAAGHYPLIEGAPAKAEPGVIIEGNDLQYIRHDGVRGGMGSTNVVIRNNRFSNFYAAAEAHRDGVQLWPGPKGARNILVEGHVLQPGETEGRFQHIFIGPDGGGYDNLVVRRNVSLGAANHGIMVAGARSGEVSENFVQPMPGYAAFIGITRVDGQPRNWGNVSPGKLTSDDPKRLNSVVKPAKGLTDRSAYDSWAAGRGGKPET